MRKRTCSPYAFKRAAHGIAARCPPPVGCPHVCASKLAPPCGRPPGSSRKKGYAWSGHIRVMWNYFSAFPTLALSKSGISGSRRGSLLSACFVQAPRFLQFSMRPKDILWTAAFSLFFFRSRMAFRLSRCLMSSVPPVFPGCPDRCRKSSSFWQPSPEIRPGWCRPDWRQRTEARSRTLPPYFPSGK